MIQRHRYILEVVGIIVVASIIGVIIAFWGIWLGPKESTAPVVINEVYLGFLEDAPSSHQWIELFNRTKEWQTLEGWSVEVGTGARLALPRTVLAPHGYAIVAASEQEFRADFGEFPGLVINPAGSWRGLDRQNDFVVLRNPQGKAIDAVNWGAGTGGPEDVELWKDARPAPGAPWMIVDGVVKVEHSYERRPSGLDRDTPADFIGQPFPSPGTVNAPSAPRSDHRLLQDWTNAASYAGGILLWVGFVYIALVARRFEALTQQRTFWQAMLFAPSGILIYNLVQAYGFQKRGRMLPGEQWWSFLILFVSGIGCAALVYIFRERAERILED